MPNHESLSLTPSEDPRLGGFVSYEMNQYHKPGDEPGTHNGAIHAYGMDERGKHIHLSHDLILERFGYGDVEDEKKAIVPVPEEKPEQLTFDIEPSNYRQTLAEVEAKLNELGQPWGYKKTLAEVDALIAEYRSIGEQKPVTIEAEAAKVTAVKHYDQDSVELTQDSLNLVEEMLTQRQTAAAEAKNAWPAPKAEDRVAGIVDDPYAVWHATHNGMELEAAPVRVPELEGSFAAKNAGVKDLPNENTVTYDYNQKRPDHVGFTGPISMLGAKIGLWLKNRKAAKAANVEVSQADGVQDLLDRIRAVRNARKAELQPRIVTSTVLLDGKVRDPLITKQPSNGQYVSMQKCAVNGYKRAKAAVVLLPQRSFFRSREVTYETVPNEYSRKLAVVGVIALAGVATYFATRGWFSGNGNNSRNAIDSLPPKPSTTAPEVATTLVPNPTTAQPPVVTIPKPSVNTPLEIPGKNVSQASDVVVTPTPPKPPTLPNELPGSATTGRTAGKIGTAQSFDLNALPYGNATNMGVKNPNAFIQRTLDEYNTSFGRQFVWNHSDGMFYEGKHILSPAELHQYNETMQELL